MKDTVGIQIYKRNPFYWQYNGSPAILLGGSKEDNLFQIDDLENHLKVLHSVGGNYIRCTMSSRDKGDEKPYLKNNAGFFDLDIFNQIYWKKFENLLSLCKELDIIVQIEIWATYDFYWGESAWANNPFNPQVNCTYTSEESKLPGEMNLPAQSEVNPFFMSVPALSNNRFLLSYQKSFVEKLLSISLRYDNILYCIDNETLAPNEWGKFWAEFLHSIAKENQKNIFVTEMWDYWDPTDGEVEGAIAQTPELGDWYSEYTNRNLHKEANLSYSMNDTETYQFLDVSNHNAQKGNIHSQTGLWVRSEVIKSGKIRPINNVKIYGGDMDDIWAGNRKDGKERFCRNIFSGHASVRFHRPKYGMGLDEDAQNFIRSMRMFTNSVDFFSFSPANHLLGDQSDNQAYCMTNDKNEYLLYFPTYSEVMLQVSDGIYEITGIHMPTSKWSETEIKTLPRILKTKTDDHWCFVVRKLRKK